MSDELSDVVRITRDLIRIDTTNWGAGRAEPESAAADYIQPILESAGLICERFEAAPGRTNMIARWPGMESGGPSLLLHSHLDVVPADASDWSHGPFDGDIADGMLWGRGAIDMKDMAAMMIAAVIRLAADGFRPRHDLVLAFFADEEDGTTLGSRWMELEHPDAFHDVTTAIGEGGGYSIEIGGARAYLMNTGEKGVRWLELRARGEAGHGSLPAADNAILSLSQAVQRVGAIEWPLAITETTRTLMKRLSQLAGLQPDTDPEVLAALAGPSATRLRAGLRDVSNVTMISAGYKANVVPASATATVDVRFIPGRESEVVSTIRAAAGADIEVTTLLELDAFETPYGGAIVSALEDIIAEVDPGAVILPHLIPGGTDAKPLRRLGIDAYGFIPLQLPADFEFPRMFHGVDERVPLASLAFGERVLRSLIQTKA